MSQIWEGHNFCTEAKFHSTSRRKAIARHWLLQVTVGAGRACHNIDGSEFFYHMARQYHINHLMDSRDLVQCIQTSGS